MNVGDYVRTRDGIIQKITDIFDTSMEIATDKGKIIYSYIDIIKSSPNIIDLIEVGDYVNGFYVINKPFNQRLHTEFDDFFEEDIKSIVTKEQFESMEYKIK